MEPPLVLHGVPASDGRAIGAVAHVVRSLKPPGIPGTPPDAEEACAQLRASASAVRTRLRDRMENATGSGRAMLEMTAVIAEDPTLLGEAERLIREEGYGAAAAIWRSGEQVAAKFREIGGQTAERVIDVVDVRNRIVADLYGMPAPGIPDRSDPYVLVADDLAPADTVSLDPELVLAIVTAAGGPTSHTAILARELGIPAVVAVAGCGDIPEGTRVGVDGANGDVFLGVADEEEFLSHVRPDFTYEGPGTTADGHRVDLMANVGDAAGARAAALIGADGIGLLRTEYIFPPSDVAPSVESQAVRYGEVFAAFPGRRVVVRTLDAGADKPLPYLSHGDEPNPALGVRGYRASMTHPSVVEDQLRAIRQAADAHTAEVWVMAPMIATTDEAEDFVARAHAAGIDMAGVMIEVPAAALRASSLLARAGFASIGTNDLTQYTMAADRTLGGLAHLSDPWDPAVLALIRLAVQGGDQQGRPVGVCGEAAASPALAAVLVGLGVSSLSMAPRAIPAVAAVLSRTTRAECIRLAELALTQESAAGARSAVRAALPVLRDLNL